MSGDWPGWAGETLNPSLGISYNRHHSNSVHCFSIYNSNPYYTVGLQHRLHGVPSAWVFVSGMIAEAMAKSFVPQKPLNSSGTVFPRRCFWGPSCLLFLRPVCLRFWGPRTSGSYWGPSCLLSKARVPSVFEVLVPPFRVSYLQPKS